MTFGALAVSLTLQTDLVHATPARSASTLVIAVLGTLLAVFLADVIAHITVHRAMPDPSAFRHMLRVSLGSLGVLVAPLALIGVAGLGFVPLEVALRATSFVLLATLVVVGYLAVRRLRLPLPQRLLVLLAEFGLGLLILALESAAH